MKANTMQNIDHKTLKTPPNPNPNAPDKLF